MGTHYRQRIQAALVLTAGLLALLIGWQTDWGRAIGGAANPQAAPAPTNVTLALLKDFAPPGGVAAYAETTARPLLTPTRQPAPPPPPPDARPNMPRGQFVLMGTVLAGGRNYALLREANGSKQTRVAQGDTVKNLLVDKVEPTQVVLRLGEETELLALKTHIPARASTPAGLTGRPPTAPGRAPATVPPEAQSHPALSPGPDAKAAANDQASGRAASGDKKAGPAQSESWPGLVDRPLRRRQ